MNSLWLIVFILVFFMVLFSWYYNTPAYKAALEKQNRQTEETNRWYAQERELYSVENILAPLTNDPNDSSYANSIPSLLDKGKVFQQYNYGTIYNLVLEILASNPDKIHIKTLCLTLGRMHYSSLRPDKNPTIYDEQAIQNDILMRSSR